MKTSCGKFLNLAHYFPYDVKLRLLAHSRSFSANQKARNAIVGAENLLINNNLDLPLEMFIAQMIVGPSKQLKQIFLIEHNIVKNPNWSESNQLAIYMRGCSYRETNPGSGQSGTRSRTSGLRVRRADHLAMPPTDKRKDRSK